MLHGLGSNFIELVHLAKHLHANDFSVYVPHLKSYSYGETIGNWEQWIDSAHKCYLEMKKKYDTVSIVGLSMGATLALALSEIENPASSVLLSAALGYDGWAMPRYAFLIKYLPFIPFLKNSQYVESGTYGLKNQEKRDVIKKRLERHDIAEIGVRSLNYSQLHQGFLLINEVKKNLHEITSPLLFMHAVDDETAHPVNIENALRKVNSTTKRIHYLSNSYHIITIDNERQVVNNETTLFLKQQVNKQFASNPFVLDPILVPELKKLMV